MDEGEAELRNPFPSPPSHYRKYTSHHLKLLTLLRERSANNPDASQYDILSDQSDVPEWPLTELEKPRVDWILDEPDGYYEVFGDRWFVSDIFLWTSAAFETVLSIFHRSRKKFLHWQN
jgi:mediator of RNA polymerase II transcription subunit 7